MFAKLSRYVKDSRALTLKNEPPENYFCQNFNELFLADNKTIKAISYDKPKKIYEACGVTVQVGEMFYQIKNSNLICFVFKNKQFLIPGLNFIDALNTIAKIPDYLTCNIEALKL